MATRQEQKRLCDMLEKFDTAMLVTRADDGTLHARPMAMAPVGEDGALWFATSLDTLKVRELTHDARVNVTFQKRDSFASLTGVARIVRDERVIEEVWSDSWKTWVGNRGDDTRLACIKIEPETAEFWDAAGGRGDRYVLEPDRGSLSQAAVPDTYDKTRY